MALLLSLLVACGGGSDLVLRDTYDSARPDTTDTTDDTTTDPGAQDCAWVGTWKLSGVRCDEASYGDWNQVYTTTRLELLHNREEGCDAIFTLGSDECTEVHTWWVDPELTDTSVTFGHPPDGSMPFGITSCEPEACKLTNGSDECVLGANPIDQEVLVDQSVENELGFTFLATFAAPTCDGALRLYFQKE